MVDAQGSEPGPITNSIWIQFFTTPILSNSSCWFAQSLRSRCWEGIRRRNWLARSSRLPRRLLNHAAQIRNRMSYSYPSRRSLNYRRLAFGALFAILLSMSSVLVLCYGVVGTNGNSLFTGTLLLGCIVAIGLVCFRREFALVKADYFFLLFLLAISFSFALNGQSSNKRNRHSSCFPWQPILHVAL